MPGWGVGAVLGGVALADAPGVTLGDREAEVGGALAGVDPAVAQPVDSAHTITTSRHMPSIVR